MSNYLRSCLDCDINTFKRNPHLTAIWEHCNDYIARSYYDQVNRDNPWLLTKKWTNDYKGNPYVNDFFGFGVSNSTMQYIGVLSNLIKHFGPLDGLRICEIGGGYGGQACTIMDIYKPACYHIIDLPEVCSLIDRYIPEVETFTMPTGQDYDLVISNYALSEIRDNDFLIKWVCKKSKHGYITCNTNLVHLDFKHIKTDDVQGERKTNYILIW